MVFENKQNTHIQIHIFIYLNFKAILADLKKPNISALMQMHTEDKFEEKSSNLKIE